MFDAKTGSRTPMTIAIYTSVWGNRIASSSAIIHAPKGKENVRSVTDKDKAKTTMLAFKEIVIAGITGNGLEIEIMTNDKDLEAQIARTCAVLLKDQDLPYRKEWLEIIDHLRKHNCKLTLVEFQETELTERATATAQFMLRQAKAAYKAAKAAEETGEEVAS